MAESTLTYYVLCSLGLLREARSQPKRGLESSQRQLRARLRERRPGSARRPGACSGARRSALLNLRSALLDTLADASLAPAAAVPPATVSACLFVACLRVLLFVASAPGLRRGSTGEMAGADPTV